MHLHTLEGQKLGKINKIRELLDVADLLAQKKMRMMAHIEVRETHKIPLQSFFKDNIADEMINFYMKQTGVQVPITRRAAGYYIFGTQQIYTRVQEGKLFVRSNGGWLTFIEFLKQHSPIESQRMKHISPELLRELHTLAQLGAT